MSLSPKGPLGFFLLMCIGVSPSVGRYLIIIMVDSYRQDASIRTADRCFVGIRLLFFGQQFIER